jgi:hypothetical protein
MVTRCPVRISLLCLAALGLPAVAVAADKKDVKLPDVLRELVAREKTDQQVRKEFIEYLQKHPGQDVNKTKEGQKLAKRMGDIDRENREWLKKQVEKHGWLGKSLVGERGAHIAWLIVQHADRDVAFQKKCLKLIEKMSAGEVSVKEKAYLIDRVRVNEGKKQVYGTQTILKDGKYVPQPIEDEKNVDKRRKAVGMEPLADYLKTIEKMMKGAKK